MQIWSRTKRSDWLLRRATDTDNPSTVCFLITAGIQVKQGFVCFCSWEGPDGFSSASACVHTPVLSEEALFTWGGEGCTRVHPCPRKRGVFLLQKQGRHMQMMMNYSEVWGWAPLRGCGGLALSAFLSRLMNEELAVRRKAPLQRRRVSHSNWENSCGVRWLMYDPIAASLWLCSRTTEK